MFRRTDCHFSLDRADIDAATDEYVPRMCRLIEAHEGRVYLDTDHPRVCVRGREVRDRPDMGYAWLADAEIFPFYELRAAAVDLRSGDRPFSDEETARRVRAQLDTLAAAGIRHAVLSAFGCGAFQNPTARVAAVYEAELRKRADDFEVVAFAIYDAGYGPNNYAPFAAAFQAWPHERATADSKGSPSGAVKRPPIRSSSFAPPPPRPKKAASRHSKARAMMDVIKDDDDES